MTLVVLILLPSLTLAQDDDRVTIRFWHIWGNVTWLPEVVEPAFEAAFPQYDLELRVLDGYRNAYDLYTLAQEQGDPPELLQGTSSNTQAPRDSGFFKPLHEAIGGPDRNQWHTGAARRDCWPRCDLLSAGWRVLRIAVERLDADRLWQHGSARGSRRSRRCQRFRRHPLNLGGSP